MDPIILLVSGQSIDRFLARGFSIVACPSSREDAEKLENLACNIAKRNPGPLKRSLEAHYQMSIGDLCEITREALDSG